VIPLLDLGYHYLMPQRRQRRGAGTHAHFGVGVHFQGSRRRKGCFCPWAIGLCVHQVRPFSHPRAALGQHCSVLCHRVPPRPRLLGVGHGHRLPGLWRERHLAPPHPCTVQQLPLQVLRATNSTVAAVAQFATQQTFGRRTDVANGSRCSEHIGLAGGMYWTCPGQNLKETSLRSWAPVQYVVPCISASVKILHPQVLQR